MLIQKEVRHFHLFCGLGGGAKGFNKGKARVGNMVAKFRCLGGIDVDPAAIKDFDMLAGVKGTVLDMFSREQYIAFHGKEPSASWRECTPEEIRRAAGYEHPHIVFLSAPCKGFSGLLSETKSKTDKYQALNGLTLRGVWLMLEAFKDDPVELIVFENVPRIANRGIHLLDQIEGLLRAYGYAVAKTTHDCGELGGLAQSRKRFLLVARHTDKVQPFLYEPEKKPLVSVGSLLNRMPLPGDSRGGIMHRVPSLQWKTWVRLAFVEAGSDWRSLNKLAVEDGKLRDYLIIPECYAGYMGVNEWDKYTTTVAGRSAPGNGNFSVADPRFEGMNYSQYGMLNFDEHMGAVSGQSAPGGGKYSIADPRMPESKNRQNVIYRVVKYDGQSHAVTGATHVAGAAMSVADPRGGEDPAKLHGKYPLTAFDESTRTVIGGSANGAYAVADPRASKGFLGKGKYKVNGFDQSAGAVIGGSTTGQGAFAVADPRPNINREKGDHYLTGGHYGVVPFDSHTGAVSASANHDNGPWSVADPRMPEANDKVIAIIRSLDDTWHRPFTTLELAAIQSLINPEDIWSADEQVQREIEHFNLMNQAAALNCFRLAGESDQSWRERIGNAVPPDAAEAIAGVMGITLLLAWSGETFTLSSQSIWVQPIAIALSVAQPVHA